MKRLKNIEVDFISLVRVPANGFDLILKNANAKAFDLIKYDEERQVAYGIVYAPEVVDSQGEFADRFEIEKAAYNYMKAGRLKNIDVEHSFEPVDCFVCESWIVKDIDPLFYDKKGAWAVGIKVEDEQIWNDIKSGKITGISMAGRAEKELVSVDGDGIIKGILEGIKGIFKKDLKEAKEMEEIKKLEERVLKSEELYKSQVEELKKSIDEIGKKIAVLDSILERVEAIEKMRKSEEIAGTKKSISTEIL